MHCSVYLIIFTLLLHEEIACVYTDTFIGPNRIPCKLDPPTIWPTADIVGVCSLLNKKQRQRDCRATSSHFSL